MSMLAAAESATEAAVESAKSAEDALERANIVVRKAWRQWYGADGDSRSPGRVTWRKQAAIIGISSMMISFWSNAQRRLTPENLARVVKMMRDHQ